MSMVKEMVENNLRMQRCLRYEGCSCPKCPLDELIDQRVQLDEDPTCPYMTHQKSARIRPVPAEVKPLLKPLVNGGFKSIFQAESPEPRSKRAKDGL